MQTLSESAIIARAKDGDTAAFKVLVELHQATIFSLASRLLGKDDAEDAVQETFIRLWKNLYKYRPGVQLVTWLYRITTNICLDQLKSKHRKTWYKMIDINRIDTVKDKAPAPDAQLEHKELTNHILKIAGKLTPKQKAAFILRDMEGLSVQEVCDILSIKPGSLKSNLYYARIKVHEKLAQYYNLSKKPLTS